MASNGPPTQQASLPVQTRASFNVDVDNLVDIEQFELVEAKRQLLKECGPTNFEVDSLDHLNMFSVLRLYHFSEKEMYLYRSDLLYANSRPMADRSKALGRVSTRNETRVLIYLWKRLLAQQHNVDHTSLKILHSQLLDKMNQLKEQTIPICSEPFSILDDARSQNFHRELLTNWRKSEINGKLRLAEWAGLRGLMSTTDLNPDDIVLSLPAEHIMSYHSVRSSPLKVLFQVEELPNDVILLLFLIFEFYNDNSPWRFYLDALPMKFDTALYYSDAELAILAGCTLAQEIQLVQQKAADTYQAVVPQLISHWPHLFKSEIFTLENWNWAQSVLDSRGIRLNLLPSGEATLCLLPLVDIINGGRISFLEGSTTVSLDPEKADSYTIRTLVSIKSGQEILMSYGAFSNRELLLYYGYVQDHNEYDFFSFDLDLDDGPTGSLQAELLARLGLGLEIHLNNDGQISSTALMIFHLLLLHHDELVQLSHISDNIVLGQKLCVDSKSSQTTRSNLKTVLEGLEANIPVIPNSNPSPSTRISNAICYFESQRSILRKVIARIEHDSL